MAIRVVSDQAKIGFVFARRYASLYFVPHLDSDSHEPKTNKSYNNSGIVMEAASSYFLPKLIGMSRASHILATGAVYPSTSPLLSQLFSEIVPTAQVLPKALEFAEDIAKNVSGVTAFMSKELMWRGTGSAEEQHLLDSKLVFECFAEGTDRDEGVMSFLEKRPADFKGSLRYDLPKTWPWYPRVDTRSEEMRGGKPIGGRESAKASKL
jgi:Enoyl-CoA hydratase/isomerase